MFHLFHVFSPGVKAAFGVAIDTQKLNDPTHLGGTPHRVGAQFTFEN
jgi:voltage-dependent anion channel protein 2